jgi:putative membrane protein
MFMNALLSSIFKGIILGIAIVLPGISGGTAFLILGLYEKIIRDLSKINLKPYWPLFCGAFAGIFISGILFSILLASYRNLTSAFLMGLLFASLKAVFNSRPRPDAGRLLVMAAGFLAAFSLANEPLGFSIAGSISPAILMLGGALAGGTMLIPGGSGSAVLILMGIYDDMLFYLQEFALGNLIIFGVGSALGIFLFARLLDKLYSQYQALMSYFFAGLIIGSVRVLWPSSFNIPVVFAFLAGFILVWKWGGDR